MPPCDVKHKDAVSALRRVKSEACKRLIYKTACLSEAKKLYNLNIKRTCPVPREKGSPAKWIDVANTPYGNPIRVAFVITLHGRAFRQVKRLFKAIYHTNHYFFFHIDSVSMFFWLLLIYSVKLAINALHSSRSWDVRFAPEVNDFILCS